MMRAAGISGWGGAVHLLELPDPRPLRADEVLIQVAASGVEYWEDVIRSGDWEVGGALPMALGVETAGTVTAVGSDATMFGVGDEVLTHCVPLREQGAWAEQVICAAADCARKPPGVAWSDAAVFPVPALTAVQVVDDALAYSPAKPCWSTARAASPED